MVRHKKINNLEALPFNGISDAGQYLNAISELWNNFSLPTSEIDYNSLPEFDVFENVNDIFERDKDIDPDNNIREIFNSKVSYISPNKLTDTNREYTDFKMINLNIRSLPKNHDAFVEMFNDILINTHIICMTETWISNGTNDIYDIPGFTSCHNFGVRKKGGGVCILIHNNILFKKLNNFSLMTSDIETVFIKIDKCYTGLDKNVIIGCCYRPPQGNVEHFTSKLNDILSALKLNDNYIYLHGDFNLNLFNIHRINNISQFYNNLQSYSLFPLFNRPTRVTSTSKTLIDNIFTNNIINTHENFIVVADITDHFPLLSQVNKTNSMKINQSISEFIRIFSANNFNKFIKACEKINFNEILTEDDPQESYQKLHTLLISANEEAFPLTKRYKSYFNKLPWLNEDLKKQIKIKNKLYSLLKKYPTQVNSTKYKNYKRDLNLKIRKSKREYYTKKLSDSCGNLKTYWKIIKEIISKSTKNTYPDFFENGKEMINNNLEIADAFNKFFTNIGSDIASKIPCTDHSHLEFLKHPNVIDPSYESFYLLPTTEAEVRNTFNDINSLSSGWDGLNKKLISSVLHLLLPCLTHIINTSFLTGILPEETKIAKIIPLFKADKPQLFNNYRPISVLPILSKIFEKLFQKRLINYLEKHKILQKYQFGFRANHSTETALTLLNHNIARGFENKQFTLAIFLDFSKAFDTVNLSILLDKLEHYGIRGLPLLWLQNYLFNRRQYVTFNNSKSKLEYNTMGVPQGSILGPLLFLIYINDLPTVSNNYKIIMYADDCSMFLSGNSCDDLASKANEDLLNILNWLRANKLTLNINKSKYMVFHTMNQKPNATISISIENKRLEEVKSFKFLGYILDPQLKWNLHISHITNKIAKNIGIITKLSRVVNSTTLRNLYFSLVQPYLTNGITIWGTANNTVLHPLIILQKCLIRQICYAKRRDASAPLFKSQKVLPLNLLYEYSVCCIMFKIYHNLSPNVINELFTTRNSISERDTRQAHHFNIPLTRNNLLHNSIYVQGPIIYNRYINIINMNCSISSFKLSLKKYLFDSFI